MPLSKRLLDYEERASFSIQELEHILQLPLVELVELLVKIPRLEAGRYRGQECRQLISKLARGRLFADLVARQAANASPEIRRGPESGEPGVFCLINAGTGENFSVRFSGDLRDYLDQEVPG